MNLAERVIENPFPGLRPFEGTSADVRVFFGRDAQVQALLSRLAEHRFLAVVGTSGSGKSSLVRAGLLPALYGGFMAGAGSHWHLAVMRPGNAPMGRLAEALEASSILSQLGGDAPLRRGLTRTVLQGGARGLLDAVTQAHLEPHDNLLVVVDQFEELFRFRDNLRGNDGSDEAAAFVKLLLEATSQTTVPIYVLITMRSDFLGDCAQFRGLPEAINDGIYLVPRMTRDQLREAIEGPVHVAGGEIAPRLVNRLLNDLDNDQDQLPVLQHALMRTWDLWSVRASSEPMDLPNYDAAGGLDHALSEHGEEIMASLASDRERELAKRLFKALTDRGTDNRGLRRPTTLGELCAITGATALEIVPILDAFRAGGRSFLTPDPSTALTESTTVDVSHESLMRTWDRLRDWVDEEAEHAQVYRRLAEAASRHANKRGGLLDDPDLSIAKQWRSEEQPTQAWAERYAPGFATAMAFLESSLNEADQKRAAQREADAARTRAAAAERLTKRTRVFAAVVSVLLIVAMVGGVAALALARRADHAKLQARTAEAKLIQLRLHQAAIIESRLQRSATKSMEQAHLLFLATRRYQKLADRNSALAAQNARLASLAMRGERVAQVQADRLGRQMDSQSLSGLDRSLYLAGSDYRYSALVGVAAYALQPGGSESDKVLLGVETPLAPALGHVALPRWDLGTTADRGRLIAVRSGGAIVIIDARTLAVDARITNAPVTMLCGFDDGPAVAVANSTRFAIYDLSNPGRPSRLETLPMRNITAMACENRGGIIVTTGPDGTLRTYSLGTDVAHIIAREPLARVKGIVLSPDDRHAATIDEHGTIRVFDLKRRRETALFSMPVSKAICVRTCAAALAFSPSGERIAWYDGAAVHVASVFGGGQQIYPCRAKDCGDPRLVYRFDNGPPNVVAPGFPLYRRIDLIGEVLAYDSERKAYEPMSQYSFQSSSAEPFYDSELQEYATDDSYAEIPNPFGDALALHSLAPISTPMLGQQEGSQWDQSYALSGHSLFLPGTRGTDSYDLSNYRWSLQNADPPSYIVRMRDSGDGRHAISVNYKTGEVRILRIDTRAVRTIGHFFVAPIPTDAHHYYTFNLQIGYDPGKRLITLTSAAGVQRLSITGRLLRSRSWAQIARTANLPLIRVKRGVLSSRGSYLIVHRSQRNNDWILRSDGRRVGQAFAIRSITRDERYAFVHRTANVPTLTLLRLPSWRSVGLTVVPWRARFVSLSADGNKIAYVAPNSQQIRLYDVRTKQLYETALPSPHKIAQYFGASISNDGRYLVVGYRFKHGKGRWYGVYDIDPQHWIRSICLMAGKPLSRSEYAQIASVAGRPYFDTCARYRSQMYRW